MCSEATSLGHPHPSVVEGRGMITSPCLLYKVDILHRNLGEFNFKLDFEGRLNVGISPDDLQKGFH